MATEQKPYDISVPQGASYEESFHYQQDDGTPIPLVGYTGFGQVRRNQDWESDLLATIDIDVVGADGVVNASIEWSDTLNLPESFYDIFLWNESSDHRIRFLFGKVKIDRRVTNWP